MHRVVSGLLIMCLLAVAGCVRKEAASQPPAPIVGHAYTFPWLRQTDPAQSILNRIPPPRGYEHVPAEKNTFPDWLRSLPLKKGRPEVRLYNGQRKAYQGAHHAVLDLDVGAKDLQQCADSVIRLRAEYLYARREYAAIHLNFTSGDRADFTKWADGYRPVVRGNSVRWVRSARPDASYRAFRAYLETVFAYAGTLSLARELRPVTRVRDVRIGDVFIQGGSPGHVAIVADLAVDTSTGNKVLLLAQGFMPAQEMYILDNPSSAALSPWFAANFGRELITREWTFTNRDLKRF